MIQRVSNEVWAFDCEWVPDLQAGRLIYGFPPDAPDEDVLKEMWRAGGATPENPQPFLRTIYCRIASIALIRRHVTEKGEVELSLKWLPANPDNPAERDEASILRLFLQEGLGRFSGNGASRNKVQLVGFNSRNADLRILLQRAIVKGLSLPAFCERMDAKPWESPDVDLMEMVAGFGKNYMVSLNDIARLCGIPGKIGTSGDDVCGLWFSGNYRKIVEYNCFDAMTTFLVWLRLAYFSGRFSKQEYLEEEGRLRTMLEKMSQTPEGAYVQTYLDEWDRLSQCRRDG